MLDYLPHQGIFGSDLGSLYAVSYCLVREGPVGEFIQSAKAMS